MAESNKKKKSNKDKPNAAQKMLQKHLGKDFFRGGFFMGGANPDNAKARKAAGMSTEADRRREKRNKQQNR